MPDLTDWLAEQHAADERVALAAENARTERGLRAASPWIAAGSLLLAAQPDGSHDAVAEVVDYQVDAVVEHIARHDPQATLARIEAERMLMAMHEPFGADLTDVGADVCSQCHHEEFSLRHSPARMPCPTLRALAWGYRGRDGLDPSWAPDGVEVGA